MNGAAFRIKQSWFIRRTFPEFAYSELKKTMKKLKLDIL
jgi:hypothetical protein